VWAIEILTVILFGMGWYPCCCDDGSGGGLGLNDLCDRCDTDTTPYELRVVIDGDATVDVDCTNAQCIAHRGTYILDDHRSMGYSAGTDMCEWSLNVPLTTASIVWKRVPQQFSSCAVTGFRIYAQLHLYVDPWDPSLDVVKLRVRMDQTGIAYWATALSWQPTEVDSDCSSWSGVSMDPTYTWEPESWAPCDRRNETCLVTSLE